MCRKLCDGLDFHLPLLTELDVRKCDEKLCLYRKVPATLTYLFEFLLALTELKNLLFEEILFESASKLST